jgi:hypothetical protein
MRKALIIVPLYFLIALDVKQLIVIIIEVPRFIFLYASYGQHLCDFTPFTYGLDNTVMDIYSFVVF